MNITTSESGQIHIGKYEAEILISYEFTNAVYTGFPIIPELRFVYYDPDAKRPPQDPEPDDPEIDDDPYIYDEDGNIIGIKEPGITGEEQDDSYKWILLEENKDYLVEISNNVTVGVAIITITGMGEYSGVCTGTFNIVPKPITELDIISDLESDRFEYTGEEFRPNILSVTFGDYDLIDGVDYKVIYEDNLNAGEAKVIVKGLNNYAGEYIINFTIVPIPIYECDISLENSSFIFDGKEHFPEVNITSDRFPDLVEGNDYELEYEGGINSGLSVVKIIGIGNFREFATKDYYIDKRRMEDSIVVSCGEPDENGEYDLENITVSIDDYILARDEEYIIKDITEEEIDRKIYTTFTVEGILNVLGSVTVTFRTSRVIIDMNDLKYIIDLDEEYFYNREEKLPQVVNVYDERYKYTLIENLDYSVEYLKNINAGTASIVIKPLSIYYSNTYVKEFEIKPLDLTNATTTCGRQDKDGCYNLNYLEVYIGDFHLRYGLEYAFDVEYDVHPFYTNAILTIRPMNTNFIGTYKVTYMTKRIYGDLNNSYFTPDSVSFIYNRNIQRPTITSSLELDRDYQIIWEDSINAGEYVVTIIGINDYIGVVVIPYKINKRTIQDGNIDLGPKDTDNSYDITNFKITVDGHSLIRNEEYRIWYVATQLEDGTITADITITGVGNYTGVRQFTCFISKKTIFTGRIITLDRAPLYIRAYGYENDGIRSGKYYLWDDIVVNDRIKITNAIRNCGVAGTIVGWVNVSDLDYIRPDKLEEEEYLEAGDEIRLYKVKVYKEFTDTKPSSIKTGRFFVSKSALYNNRIRICAFHEHVGSDKRVIGWIDVDDANN